MMQKTQARSTDLKVIVGSVGSSSKLTTFRTRSGMLVNSSESKSYCGSSSEAVCSFGALLSFSSASLSVTLDMAGIFSFAGVAMLLTDMKDLTAKDTPQVSATLREPTRLPLERCPPQVIVDSSLSSTINRWYHLGEPPCLSFDQRPWYTHILKFHFLSGNMQ